MKLKIDRWMKGHTHVMNHGLLSVFTVNVLP